jgi:hypothetical protein
LRTRDRERSRNTLPLSPPYGFRRNLLGLKWPALLLDAAIVVVCVIVLWMHLPVSLEDSLTQKVLAVLVVAFLHALYFSMFVNKTAVIEAGKLYGRQLLLCCETLGSGPVRAPVKKT